MQRCVAVKIVTTDRRARRSTAGHVQLRAGTAEAAEATDQSVSRDEVVSRGPRGRSSILIIVIARASRGWGGVLTALPVPPYSSGERVKGQGSRVKW